MPSTTSLYTGLSALSVNSQRLDSIGNNIANVNTTAFKSSRMLFSSQFARTLGGWNALVLSPGERTQAKLVLGLVSAEPRRTFPLGPSASPVVRRMWPLKVTASSLSTLLASDCTAVLARSN